MPIYDYKCKKCKAEFTVSHPTSCVVQRCGDLSDFMSRKDPYEYLSQVENTEFYDDLMEEVLDEKGWEKFCGLDGEVVRIYDGSTATLDTGERKQQSPGVDEETERDMSGEAVEARIKKSINDAKKHKEKQISDLMGDLESDLISNIKGKK